MRRVRAEDGADMSTPKDAPYKIIQRAAKLAMRPRVMITNHQINGPMTKEVYKAITDDGKADAADIERKWKLPMRPTKKEVAK